MKIVQLCAHIINEIEVGEGEEHEESTARALLAHHKEQLENFGIHDIDNRWLGSCTDKEACYLKMGKLQQEVNAHFLVNPDASHGMESLFTDVENNFLSLENHLNIISVAYARYSGSPKKKGNCEGLQIFLKLFIVH